MSDQYWCPACQGRNRTEAPELHVHPDHIECARCGFEGDALELVMEAQACAPDQASQWLAEFMDGPEAAALNDAPSRSSDSSVDMLDELAGVLNPEATADIEPGFDEGEYDLSVRPDERPSVPSSLGPTHRPDAPSAPDLNGPDTDRGSLELDEEFASGAANENDFFAELEQHAQAEDYVEDVGDIDTEDKMAATKAILNAFLESCDPLSPRLNKWLAHSEISDEVIEQLQLRSLPRDYMRISQALVEEYGQRSVLDAGLMVLRRGPRPNQPIALPAFRSFFGAAVEMLIVPFLRHGEPVFFNALPMARPEKLKKMNLRQRRTTNANEPALLNEDVIDNAERLLLCRGEFLTMIALSHGYDAVGVSGWSRFDPSWAHWFADREVLLVGPHNESAEVSIGNVRYAFQNAGLPEPDVLLYEAGTSLADFLDQHIPPDWSSGIQ